MIAPYTDSRTWLSKRAPLPGCLAIIPNHSCASAQAQQLLTTLKPANGVMALPAAIIGREIAMSALREWAASSSPEAHQAVAVSSWGKWKTATQVPAAALWQTLANRASALNCRMHAAVHQARGNPLGWVPLWRLASCFRVHGSPSS